MYQNWMAVFNSNPFLWFLPLNKNEDGDGCFFSEEDIRKRENSIANGATKENQTGDNSASSSEFMEDSFKLDENCDLTAGLVED